jgi:SAM-dependent methyltransferase
VSERIPRRITWAVEQLDVRPSQRVLEIGCGGGHALSLLAPKLARGELVGIDRSKTQVAAARKRNPGVTVEPIALDDAVAAFGKRRFHHVLAINVNAFWTDPAPAIAAVRALLRPKGSLLLVYETPSPARTRQLRDDVPVLLETHGFGRTEVRVEGPRGLCLAVVAR